MSNEKDQQTFPSLFVLYIATLLASLLGAFIGRTLSSICQSHSGGITGLDFSCFGEFVIALTVGQAFGYIVGAYMIFSLYSFKAKGFYYFLLFFILDCFTSAVLLLITMALYNIEALLFFLPPLYNILRMFIMIVIFDDKTVDKEEDSQ
ncbi:MAG: hypothetical protein WCP97_01230 [bacterium]